MKKILVLKTAEEKVMQKLLLEVKEKEEMYCLVQSSALDVYKRKYPDFNVLDIAGESFTEQTSEYHGLKQMKFETIYIPSSTPYFRNFDNVFFMVDRLNYEKMVLYDCNGNKRVMKQKNGLGSILESVLVKVWMTVCAVGYQIKTKVQGDV